MAKLPDKVNINIKGVVQFKSDIGWVVVGEVDDIGISMPEWSVDLSTITVKSETLSGQLSKVALDAENAKKSFAVFKEAFKELKKVEPKVGAGHLPRESRNLPGMREIVESPCLNGGYLEKVLNRDPCKETAWDSVTKMVEGDWPHTTAIREQIMHLNDYHRLTRGEIADWLETLDIDLSF